MGRRSSKLLRENWEVKLILGESRTFFLKEMEGFSRVNGQNVLGRNWEQCEGKVKVQLGELVENRILI